MKISHPKNYHTAALNVRHGSIITTPGTRLHVGYGLLLAFQFPWLTVFVNDILNTDVGKNLSDYHFPEKSCVQLAVGIPSNFYGIFHCTVYVRRYSSTIVLRMLDLVTNWKVYFLLLICNRTSISDGLACR